MCRHTHLASPWRSDGRPAKSTYDIGQQRQRKKKRKTSENVKKLTSLRLKLFRNIPARSVIKKLGNEVFRVGVKREGTTYKLRQTIYSQFMSLYKNGEEIHIQECMTHVPLVSLNCGTWGVFTCANHPGDICIGHGGTHHRWDIHTSYIHTYITFIKVSNRCSAYWH